MQILNWLEPRNTSKIATIGAFDGVHLGHQEIINKLKKESQDQGLVITFDPLPKKFFSISRGFDFIEIISLDQKIQLFRTLGVAELLIIPFLEIKDLAAKDFVNEILIKKLNIKKLIVGYDFHFGRDRQGNCEFLLEYFAKDGRKIEIVPELKINPNNSIKATKIRNLINKKQFKKANQLLGWNYKELIENNSISLTKTSLVAKQSPKAS